MSPALDIPKALKDIVTALTVLRKDVVEIKKDVATLVGPKQASPVAVRRLAAIELGGGGTILFSGPVKLDWDEDPMVGTGHLIENLNGKVSMSIYLDETNSKRVLESAKLIRPEAFELSIAEHRP